MNRREWLKLLPGLPLLGSSGTGQTQAVESGRRLANGAILYSRQVYETCLNGTRRLVEDVDWIVAHGQTVSTTWKLWRQ